MDGLGAVSFIANQSLHPEHRWDRQCDLVAGRVAAPLDCVGQALVGDLAGHADPFPDDLRGVGNRWGAEDGDDPQGLDYRLLGKIKSGGTELGQLPRDAAG